MSETVSVECYSGTRYAERPTALTWQGATLAVEFIERAWQTPAGRAFIVRAGGGRRFELAYDEASDRWTAHPLN